MGLFNWFFKNKPDEKKEIINTNNQLLNYVDPKLDALKLEIRNLEDQLNSYDIEKSELEKILAEFQNKHAKELGEIILEILKLRKQFYRDDEEKYKEAEKDEKDYQEQVNLEKEKITNRISDEDRAVLKKKFRKASKLCHPDKFINEPLEIQKLSNEIFKDLLEANEQNDLNRVNEILSNLEKGILVRKEGEKIDDTKILQATILRLTNKLKVLKIEIEEIKKSETYRTISEIENLSEYFAGLKLKLETELLHLKEQTDTI